MNTKSKIISDVEKKYRKMNYHTDEKKEYKEYEVAYILANATNKTDVLAFISDKTSDEVFYFNPYTDTKPNIAFGFSFDDFFFDYLDKYEIVKMPMDSHIAVWCEVENNYESDGTLPKTIQKYLSYCDKHNITHKKMKGYVETDIMQFYDRTVKHREQDTIKER